MATGDELRLVDGLGLGARDDGVNFPEAPHVFTSRVRGARWSAGALYCYATADEARANAEADSPADRIRIDDLGDFIWSPSELGADNGTTIIRLTGVAVGAYVATSGLRQLTVSPVGADTDRGAALLATYAAAKLLTPGGAALGATNRVTVVIPPGNYDLGASTLTLDTSYVDLTASTFSRGDPSTDYLGPGGTQAFGRDVVIYSAGGGRPVVKQTAINVRLSGFEIRQNGNTSHASDYEAIDNGFLVAADNSESIYDCMHFEHRAPSVDPATLQRLPMTNIGGVDLAGTWYDCTCNGLGWRLAMYTTLRGRYYRCHGGLSSFAGDQHGTCIDAYMWGCTGATQSFCGCQAGSFVIGEHAELWYCTASDRSFAIAGEIRGKLYYCKGGEDSFAGCSYDSQGSPWGGGISGTLVGCEASGGHSFGARDGSPPLTLVARPMLGVSGTLRDCVCLDMSAPVRLNGGRLENCTFKITTASLPAARITKATGSKIYSSTLIAGAGASVSVTNEIVDELDRSAVYGPRLRSVLNTDGTRLTPGIVASSVTINYTTGGVAKTITDNGSGGLIGDVASGTNTITYATGAYDVTLVGMPETVAGSTVKCTYRITAAADVISLRSNAAIDTAGSLTTNTTGIAATVDARPPRLLAVSETRVGPWSCCYGGGNLYVITDGEYYAQRLGQDSSDYLRSNTGLNAGPNQCCVDAAGYLWITNYGVSTIQKLNPLTLAVVATVTVGATPLGICYDTPTDTIWCANQGAGGGTVSRVNATTHAVVTTVTAVGSTPSGICSDQLGNIWVANLGANNAKRITMSNNTIAATVSSITGAYMPAYLDGFVWVTQYGANTVKKINAATDTVSATVTLLNAAGSSGSTNTFGFVCAAGGRVYVTNAVDNVVNIIDTTSNAVLEVVPVGASPRGIATAATQVAVACYDSNEVWRLRV